MAYMLSSAFMRSVSLVFQFYHWYPLKAKGAIQGSKRVDGA
jgi:hypothetical protein